MKNRVIVIRPSSIIIVLLIIIMLAQAYIIGTIITEKQIQKTIGQFLYESGQQAVRKPMPRRIIRGTNQ